MRRGVVETGDVAHLHAAFGAGLDEAHRHFFQGFQAVGGEAGTEYVHLLDPLPGKLPQPRLGIRAQPALGAEARLVAELPLPGLQAQRSGDRLRTGFAALRVGIAVVGHALRQAMEGEEQALAAAMLRPVRTHAVGHRRDPGRVGRVVLDQVHRQLRMARLPGLHHILDRGGGGGRILRVQRQHHDPAHAGIAQRVQGRRQRRRAVAHRPGHAMPGQFALHAFGQAPGIHRQRRAVGQPHLRILLGRLGRAPRQDHPVQQWPPEQPRDRDHALVAKELGQITGDRRRGRRLGRA
ncbi:hypothetical protein NB689_003255 [Xanthomonas sacchari]|nr:hypothetical protein [Xanthomonas sacchari]